MMCGKIGKLVCLNFLSSFSPDCNLSVYFRSLLHTHTHIYLMLSSHVHFYSSMFRNLRLEPTIDYCCALLYFI